MTTKTVTTTLRDLRHQPCMYLFRVMSDYYGNHSETDLILVGSGFNTYRFFTPTWSEQKGEVIETSDADLEPMHIGDGSFEGGETRNKNTPNKPYELFLYDEDIRMRNHEEWVKMHPYMNVEVTYRMNQGGYVETSDLLKEYQAESATREHGLAWSTYDKHLALVQKEDQPVRSDSEVGETTPIDGTCGSTYTGFIGH